MHLNAIPPMFVPQDYWREMEKLSKAALMDLVWDYAIRGVGEDRGPDAVMANIREYAEIITEQRRYASKHDHQGSA